MSHDCHMIWRLVEGEECPIGLLWTSSERDMQSIGNYSIYTLADLDKSPCAVRLGLTKEVFRRNGSQCPLTFQWGGKVQSLSLSLSLLLPPLT